MSHDNPNDLDPAQMERAQDAMVDIVRISDDLLDILPELTKRPSLALFGCLMVSAKLTASLSLPIAKIHEALDALYSDAQQHEKERFGEH